MSEENKIEICPLCHEQHESMSLYGVEYIACPMVPKDTFIPKETLDLLFQNRSVLEQPVIT